MSQYSLQITSRKPEDRNLPTVGEISEAGEHGSKGEGELEKGAVVSAALCTHLGINIGVKGPTAFELFMVYRALGGRKRR